MLTAHFLREGSLPCFHLKNDISTVLQNPHNLLMWSHKTITTLVLPGLEQILRNYFTHET